MNTTKHENLAAALAAFQKNLPTVAKDSINPHFKSRYADLSDMSKIILPALAAEGLAFASMPTLTERGFVLSYMLVHESGDKIEGEYPLNNQGNEQQKGSSITYARRYALGAVTGVAADEDDDGNQASQVKSVAPPEGWRERIMKAQDVQQLTAIYTEAVAAGWAQPHVMESLTERKNELNAANNADTNTPE